MLKNSYRLKYEKIGMMKFVGHLDLLRVMQRSINRCNLPISYSNGFNPHQIISFALPLSLGFETYGDYLEIELEEDMETKSIIELLNKSLPRGLKIISCFKKTTNDGKCAALLCASTYLVKSHLLKSKKDDFENFINQNEIITFKKTKKSEKEVNIKKDILGWKFDENLHVTISTGSNGNLKVDTVLKAFFEYSNLPFDIDKFDIFREEMYYKLNDKLQPLGVGIK